MVDQQAGKNLTRVAGTALLFVALVMFVNAFIAAEHTPMGRDLRGCRPNVPCDVGEDSSHREEVFFQWMGATLVVLTGGVVLRSLGRRD